MKKIILWFAETAVEFFLAALFFIGFGVVLYQLNESNVSPWAFAVIVVVYIVVALIAFFKIYGALFKDKSRRGKSKQSPTP